MRSNQEMIFFTQKERFMHQCPWVGWGRNQKWGTILRLHSQLNATKRDYLLRWRARFATRIPDENLAKPVYKTLLDNVIEGTPPDYDALISQSKLIVEAFALKHWRPDKSYGFLAHLNFSSINQDFGFGNIEIQLNRYLQTLVPEQPHGETPLSCTCLKNFESQNVKHSGSG